MPGIYTSVEGMDEIVKAFEQLGEKANVYAQEAANRAGEVVLARVKARAPVLKTTVKRKEPGQLKDSAKLIKAKTSKTGVTCSQVTFDKSAFYATQVELGHRVVRKGNKVGTVAAHPFIRPAADESVEEVVSIMTDAVNKALEELL